MKKHPFYIDLAGIVFSCLASVTLCEILKTINMSNGNRLLIALPIATVIGLTSPTIVKFIYFKFRK